MVSILVNDLLKNHHKYLMKKSDFVDNSIGAHGRRQIDILKDNPRRIHGYTQDYSTRFSLNTSKIII